MSHAATPAARPMVDWQFARGVAARLAGDGPEVERAEAAAVVAELREDAAKSTGYVRDFTGLDATDGTAPVLVVDRPGWIRANTEALEVASGPLIEKVRGSQSGAIPHAVGSKVTGAEVGGLLGFLAGKVLGQFDPFWGPDGAERGTSERPRDPFGAGSDGAERGTSERPRDPSGAEPAGRLLLVAPNVVHVERQLDVDPHDFRLWVCLHEETHRVQFTAVPWMRDHLFSEVAAISETIEPNSLFDGGLERLAEAVRTGRNGGSVVEMFSTPAQREILDRVTGMMSLLEGHADVVMDDVGPQVIPSVAEIRRKFTKRRQGVGTLDRLLRRLLGLDAKMAQYRDGAKFVRAIVDRVGMEQFNAVWDGPAHLPTKEELADPDAWIRRVL